MSGTPSSPQARPRRRTRIVAALALVAAGCAPASAAGYVSRPDLTPPPIALHTPGNGDLAAGSVFLAPKRRSGTEHTGPLIVDDAAQPIWFRPNPDDVRATDFRVQQYEGKPVLTWWEGRSSGGHGQGVGVIADASYRVIERVRMSAPYRMDLHEFRLTSRGTALAIAYHTTRRDLRSVGGARNGRIIDCVVQEIDVASGKALFTWHSLGSIGLAESYRDVPRSATTAWDYFHANSVDVDADRNLIVSARYTNSVTKISRRTGRVIWRLGGKRSDFKMAPGTRVHLAHDAEWVDGKLRIFDNSEKSIRDRSRVVVLDVDAKRRRVTLERDVRHPQSVLAATQGNAETVGGDDLFVGWGSQGRWSEFGPDGTLRYDAELADGYDSYRVYRFAWHGRPATVPDVAARSQADGNTAVYVSWNGATGVAAWRVLTGAAATSLAPGGVTPRQGFETAMVVPGRPASIAVQALDAAGDVLATSRAVAASSG